MDTIVSNLRAALHCAEEGLFGMATIRAGQALVLMKRQLEADRKARGEAPPPPRHDPEKVTSDELGDRQEECEARVYGRENL